MAWNSRDPLLRVAFEQLVKLSLSDHSNFFSSTVWVWGFWNIFAKDKEASSLEEEEEKIQKKEGVCDAIKATNKLSQIKEFQWGNE